MGHLYSFTYHCLAITMQCNGFGRMHSSESLREPHRQEVSDVVKLPRGGEYSEIRSSTILVNSSLFQLPQLGFNMNLYQLKNKKLLWLINPKWVPPNRECLRDPQHLYFIPHHYYMHSHMPTPIQIEFPSWLTIGSIKLNAMCNRNYPFIATGIKFLKMK